MPASNNANMSETLADRNRKFFNTASSTIFKNQWVHDVQQQIRKHLHSNTKWLGINEATKLNKMLDYACGNGVPSQVLAPHFTTCIGMDISEGMLETYKTAAHECEQDFPETQMRAVKGDLMADDVDPALLGDEMSDFDLVVISMALHHLEHPHKAVQRLIDRLRVGGVLLIVDKAVTANLSKEQHQQTHSGGHDHHHVHHATAPIHAHGNDDDEIFKDLTNHTIAHNSFTQEQIEDMFTKAACNDVDFVLLPEKSPAPTEMGGEMQLFFAKGIKAVG